MEYDVWMWQGKNLIFFFQRWLSRKKVNFNKRRIKINYVKLLQYFKNYEQDGKTYIFDSINSCNTWLINDVANWDLQVKSSSKLEKLTSLLLFY